MKKIIFLLSLFFGSFAFGQIKDTIIDGEKTSYYKEVEKVAEFPKGIENLRNIIIKNFRLKKIKTSPEINRIDCEITFVVDKDGKMTNIKATGDNESFNKEAVRAVSKIKEIWKPAKINDLPVRYRFKIPLWITFK